MKIKKHNCAIACISAFISTPLYAQVSEAEFEALLNQNRESSRVSDSQLEDTTSTLEVVELLPEHLFQDIDTNRIEVDALKSEIEVLEAKRQILALTNEIRALEEGGPQAVEAQINQQRSSFIDSTMRSTEPDSETEHKNEEHELIRRLEAQMLHLEESLTRQLERQVQALQPPRPVEENQPEPTPEEPSLLEPISDQYTVVSTSNVNGSPRARLSNQQGNSFDVRQGEVFGSQGLEVVSINHREVIARKKDGNVVTLTPNSIALSIKHLQISDPN